MSLINEKSRTVRAVFLSVMSICGSVAATVWLLTSDVAMAEVKQTAEQAKKTAVTTLGTSTKTNEAQKPPAKKRKKLINFGSFEGY